MGVLIGILLVAFVAGVFGSMLGVGGGVIMVPMLSLAFGVPMKATIATSNLMIGVTAATGAAIFYGRGYMDVLWAVPAALGILAGARLEPRLVVRLLARVLAIVFQAVLAIFGVFMLLQASAVVARAFVGQA